MGILKIKYMLNINTVSCEFCTHSFFFVWFCSWWQILKKVPINLKKTSKIKKKSLFLISVVYRMYNDELTVGMVLKRNQIPT